MRNLSEVSIHNRVLVWYFIILVAIAGIFSYMKLGRMEDPTYTVRTMVVSVAWPGATAEQMQEQVTDKIEKKLQGYAEPGLHQELFPARPVGHLRLPRRQGAARRHPRHLA